MRADPDTIAFYDREARAYAERGVASEDRPFLAAFLAKAPPGASTSPYPTSPRASSGPSSSGETTDSTSTSARTAARSTSCRTRCSST